MTSGQCFKLTCLIIYGAIVGGLTIVAQANFDSSSHAEAARAIRENQIISESDLRPVGQKDISGHAALRGFAVGQKITTRDVSEPSTPPFDNTVAAVVTLRRSTGGVGIQTGASMQLCLDRKPFGKPSKVAMAICGDRNCLVAVPLTEWPSDATSAKVPQKSKSNKSKKTQDANGAAQPKPVTLPVEAARLTAVPEGEKCDGV